MKTNLTTTDHTIIGTNSITTSNDRTETTTKNPDTKTSKVDSKAGSVSSTMSLKSDSTPKFQKCLKNQNKNLMMPNTTKKFNNLNKNNPSS